MEHEYEVDANSKKKKDIVGRRIEEEKRREVGDKRKER
jgi:hypothetical protein